LPSSLTGVRDNPKPSNPEPVGIPASGGVSSGGPAGRTRLLPARAVWQVSASAAIISAPSRRRPTYVEEAAGKPGMAELFSSLFPAPVAAASVTLSDFCFPLFPEEEFIVARAVPKRRVEFSAGRHCARSAIRQLGYTDCAIPHAKDRAPVWPYGLIGSIAHTAGYCAAVVAIPGQLRSLGIDVEQSGAVSRSLLENILLPREIQQMQLLESSSSLNWLAAFFCAKEAAYKAFYTMAREFIGFHDAQIRFDLEQASFTAEILRRPVSTAAWPSQLWGRYAALEGRIYTSCWW
jgi:4'-phosphopantetheinyl transferase EntD